MSFKGRLLIALWVVLLTPSLFAQSDSRLFSQAKAAEAEGRKEAALLFYRQLVRYYPESPYVDEALFLVGMYHYDSRNYFEADQVLREHTRRFPNSRFNKAAKDCLGRMQLRSLKDRADTLFDAGNLDAASILYQQYLDIDPENAEVKARLERMKKAQAEGVFGFEQLSRERKRLEEEKADLNRQVGMLDEQKKQLEIRRKAVEELNKVTVEKYEKQLAGVKAQVEMTQQEMANLRAELSGWRQRAILAETVKLSQPLAKRLAAVPDEKTLPRIAFEGGKPDPSPEEGEEQISNVLKEGFPTIVITQAKLDTDKKVRHVEAIVIADLKDTWPEGAKIKFRADFAAKQGKPAPDPAFVVIYYDNSDMEEIDEVSRSYKKRVLFTAEEDKVAGYEVSAFLVKTK